MKSAKSLRLSGGRFPVPAAAQSGGVSTRTMSFKPERWAWVAMLWASPPERE